MAKFNDLREAVMARDCARLRQLVRGGIDVDSRDSMKRTVLHIAAVNLWGEYMKDEVQTLVDLGADINAADFERKTPLHYTLLRETYEIRRVMIRCEIMKQRTMRQQTQEETAVVEEAITHKYISAVVSGVKYLVRLGADINARFDLNVTSLHRAIQLNNIRLVEALLRLGVDVNAVKKINCTALHLTLDRVETTLMKRLVELGADVNAGYNGLPPLLEAVDLGRMDIIKMLIQHRADITLLRFDNKTPVVYAVKNRNTEAVKSLAQLGADLSPKWSNSSIVNEIVKLGSVDILEYLFKHNAQAEALSPGLRRLTPLGIAVMGDYLEIVDCLVKTGADVNARFDQGISPLVTAIRLGDSDMVKALAKLEPKLVNPQPQIENITVLCSACDKDPKIMELLLKYGGDVNRKYDDDAYAVHEAVKQGKEEMVRVLAELGADLNCKRAEGVTLIHYIIERFRDEKAPHYMAMIKLLVEAGLDLNQRYNSRLTPLHDAVTLGDSSMVQILGELKADMNATKNKGESPVFQVLESFRKDSCITDMIRYFAKNRLDVNSRMTTHVTPLHDAVRLGDVDMVRVLINSGARRESGKHIVTILHLAISTGNNEAVKCLLECGADVNAKTSVNISALHDAVENSNLAMISILGDHNYPDMTAHDQFTPIHQSIFRDQSDITETLLKYEADLSCLQDISMTPLDVALDQGKVECVSLLMSQNMRAYRDTIGSSPLHAACRHGHIDLARLLITQGSDVNKRDCYGKKPLECLPLASTADYHVLQETKTIEKNAIVQKVPTSFITTSRCQNMTTSLHTPGIGDVRFISSPSPREISEGVHQLLESITQQCKAFPGRKLKNIGSSAEGTRVGLPNEMDFLFGVQLAKDEERKIVDLGNGYVKYDYVMEGFIRMGQISQNSDESGQNMFPTNKGVPGSAGFHTTFIEEAMNRVFLHSQNTASDKKVSVATQGAPGINDSNRKACSLFTLIWEDGKSLFDIPVDIVPGLHIDNWPEGATTRTWLMDEQELRSRGYVLVPKPPQAKSDLAKECTEEDLTTLWKISFPHLETEHMQKLEQRVKDVYITAKCLRNPDVCRIMITDDGSLPRTVGKYVTSYQLKMCFFKNAEYFCQHNELCLEEMVCKVYDDLVLGLSKNFIPIFFLPNVSALSGIKVNVSKCVKVAKIMARFVRALYHRDCLGEGAVGGVDDATLIHQEKPSSVYKVYDISSGDD